MCGTCNQDYGGQPEYILNWSGLIGCTAGFGCGRSPGNPPNFHDVPAPPYPEAILGWENEFELFSITPGSRGGDRYVATIGVAHPVTVNQMDIVITEINSGSPVCSFTPPTNIWYPTVPTISFQANSFSCMVSQRHNWFVEDGNCKRNEVTEYSVNGNIFHIQTRNNLYNSPAGTDCLIAAIGISNIYVSQSGEQSANVMLSWRDRRTVIY